MADTGRGHDAATRSAEMMTRSGEVVKADRDSEHAAATRSAEMMTRSGKVVKADRDSGHAAATRELDLPIQRRSVSVKMESNTSHQWAHAPKKVGMESNASNQRKRVQKLFQDDNAPVKSALPMPSSLIHLLGVGGWHIYRRIASVLKGVARVHVPK